MPTGTPAGGMGTAESHDVRVTDIPTLCYEGTDDYVMRLADTLLAIKAGMDAARDGQYAPDSDEVSVTSDSLRAVLETLPQTLTSPVQMEEHEIAPEDIAGRPLSPREAFDQQRQEEFMEEFRQRTAETIRRWDEDEWQEWREAREDLAQYMKGNLRRERKPPYNMFIDEEVEALLRRRYEDANPCPSWHLALQWQRYGRLLHGREERWPGYDEARRKWDAESESIWQRLQTKKRPKNPDAPRAKVAVA